MGVGFYWLDMSSDLDDFAINKLEDELGIEAFYNIALTPWLQISVDFQWIDTGVVENDNAVFWVPGCSL
jgi:porin